jgi:hypothetical protein
MRHLNSRSRPATDDDVDFLSPAIAAMLSNRAAEAMQQEISDLGLSEKAPGPTWNQAMLHQVVAALHGATP